MQIKNCPCCNKNNFQQIFNSNNVPLYNLNYQDNLQSALNVPKIYVDFVKCSNCEFVFNQYYNQLDYQVDYNVNRSYSMVFKNYLDRITNKLLKELPDDIFNIVEIGASHCDFAYELLNLKSDFKYHAFDPSTPSTIKKHPNLINYKQYYDSTIIIKPDLLILRHVLEHMSDVNKFMNSILHESPKYLFIEIPCFEFLETENGYNYHFFSNEHCSYFNTNSFKYFMYNLGYTPIYLDREFNDEYIVSFWKKNETNTDYDYSSNNNLIISSNTFLDWKLNIRNLVLNNSIIWGGGGKGVMLSNILELNHLNTRYIIDLNHEIWGKFTPSNAIEIAPPEVLKTKNYTNVINLNPLYHNEIENQIKKIGVDIKVSTIFN